MKRILLLLTLAIIAVVAVTAAASAEPFEIVSRLRGEPKADPNSDWPIPLEAASPDVLARLPSAPGQGDRIFSTILPVLDPGPFNARVVLVEPPASAPFLFVDQDLDGILSAAERFDFGPQPGKESAVLLRFPLNNGGLPFFPVLLSLPVKSEEKEGERLLFRSNLAYFDGLVEVAGREVRVRYPIDPSTGEISLRLAMMGMDVDNDGKVDPDLSKSEMGTLATWPEPPVFRLGPDLFLSTRRVEACAGRVVLQAHPASDYKVFDLHRGSPLDFAFTDIDGNPRRLADLRGKVVLLDFWGTWCFFCVKEMPTLRKAYAAYRAQGFEILGMDYDDDLATLQGFAAEKDAPWLHATADSVEALVEESFRIRSFPTKILLDRQGRVISVSSGGQPPLAGEPLLKTIEEALGVTGDRDARE